MDNFNEELKNEALKGRHVSEDATENGKINERSDYQNAKHAALGFSEKDNRSLDGNVGKIQGKEFSREEEEALQERICESVCVSRDALEQIPTEGRYDENGDYVLPKEHTEENDDITGDENYDDAVIKETLSDGLDVSNEIEGSEGAGQVRSGVILSAADVDRLTGSLGDRDNVPSKNSEDEVVDEGAMGDAGSEEIVAAEELEDEATDDFKEEHFDDYDDIASENSKFESQDEEFDDVNDREDDSDSPEEDFDYSTGNVENRVPVVSREAMEEIKNAEPIMDHEAEAERLRDEIENSFEDNHNDEYNETEVIDSKEKAEIAEKEHIDEEVNEEEFVEEKDTNWDDEVKENTDEEHEDSLQEINGRNKSFVNAENSIKHSFVWPKATHKGVCKKCGKNAIKYGLQPKETELNDKELCRDHARKRKTIIGALIGLIAALLLALVIGLCSGWLDPNALNGPYDGISQEDLNAQVADGEMNVSIANTIYFPDGSTNPGRARIYNHQNNHVDQKVAIYMEDTNELLYESGAIAPNQHIDNITLNKELAPGSYKVIAIFTGYKRDSGNPITDTWNHIFNIHTKSGALGAKINLVVQ